MAALVMLNLRGREGKGGEGGHSVTSHTGRLHSEVQHLIHTWTIFERKGIPFN